MADKIKGKDISIFVNGYVIGCAEDGDIEITTSMFTVTSKCSMGANGVIWEENLPNIQSMKFSGGGFVPVSTSQGYDEYSFQQLALAQFSQIKVYVTWGISGTNLFYGIDGYLSSVKMTSPFNDAAKFTYEITATGAPTTSPVS